MGRMLGWLKVCFSNLIEVQKAIEQCRQVIVDAMDRNQDQHTAASMEHALIA
jgi:hypothetical protein